MANSQINLIYTLGSNVLWQTIKTIQHKNLICSNTLIRLPHKLDSCQNRPDFPAETHNKNTVLRKVSCKVWSRILNSSNNNGIKQGGGAS